ncbi:FAD binding domain-containing protein [Apiospora hydei]|uniref:FAD binding domain-containing protein n=1 Tax=Apiospora hydei TaxID=1337664 RepID=A0ABR1WXP8_9PEZI
MVNLEDSETAHDPSTMLSPRPVIVVGSDLAGLSVAYEALQAGARVHMLDCAPKPGGNSIKASLGINGAYAPPGRFRLSSSAEVVSLSVRDDAITGVWYVQDRQTHDLDGAIVFAAGGFAGDATGLLAKYRPDLAALPSTNDDRPGSHSLLEAVGVELVDMTSVQVHPTGFVDPKDPATRYKFLAAEALRADKRFVNELDTREKVSEAIMNMPHSRDSSDSSRQWDVTLLMDPGACEATAGHLGFYVWKGLMQKKKVGDLNPAAIAAGRDGSFGRVNFGHWRIPAGEATREEEVCVGKVTPVTHFTLGGAAFNDNTSAPVTPNFRGSGQL